MLKKNSFVKHPKLTAWGTGIVIEDQRGDDVSVFFEDIAEIRKFRLVNGIQLDIVTPSESSRNFLENLMLDMNSPKETQPFPTKVKHFLEDFSGGFYGDMFCKEERDYKVEAQEVFVELLNQSAMKDLIDDRNWEELATRIKRVYSKTNLLASFEMIKLSSALKDNDSI